MFNKDRLLKSAKSWPGPTEFLRVILPNSLSGYAGVKLGMSHCSYIHHATTRQVGSKLMYLDDLDQTIGLEIVLHDKVSAITDRYLAGLLLREVWDFPESGLLKKTVRFKHADPAVVERAERTLLMMFIGYTNYVKKSGIYSISSVSLYLNSLD